MSTQVRQTKMYQATAIRRVINEQMAAKYPMPANVSKEDEARVLATRKSEGNKIAKARYREELDMTDQGAATFCRNVCLFLEGKDPYASNKAANAKRKQALDVANAMPGLEKIATTLGDLYHEPKLSVENRWWLVNESTKRIVASYTNRDAARASAKVLGVKLVDRQQAIVAA